MNPDTLDSLKRVVEITQALNKMLNHPGTILPVSMVNRLPKDSPDRWALELAINNYTSSTPWMEGKAVSLPTMNWILDHAAAILAAEHAEV